LIVSPTEAFQNAPGVSSVPIGYLPLTIYEIGRPAGGPEDDPAAEKRFLNKKACQHRCLGVKTLPHGSTFVTYVIEPNPNNLRSLGYGLVEIRENIRLKTCQQRAPSRARLLCS
jgi:hypothetical protein